MSTTSSGTDLNTKYQKLAAEYAKLRNQVPVLKKAVLEEQSKNAELNEELKEKEQVVRKVNVEIESLTFRNQQLTKRVESLQKSVEQLSSNQKNNQKQHHGKKIPKSVSEQAMSASNGRDSQDSVIEEELQRKLAENEHLHKRIYDMQSQHEMETQKLLSRIKSLESDSSTIRSDLSVIRNQHDAMVDELKLEKERLHKSLQFVQTKLSDSAGELQKYRLFCESMEEADDSAVVADAPPSLPSIDEIGIDRPSMIEALVVEELDPSNISQEPILPEERLMSLDVPCIDMSIVENYVKFLLLLRPHLSDLANHLSNYHSYCEQRCKLYPCDSSLEELSATSINYGALLKDKSNVCRSISTAFDAMCDKLENNFAQHIGVHNDIKLVLDHFSSYVKFLDQLLPLFKKSVEEECLISWCNQRLERENRSYQQLFENSVVVLSQLQTELLRSFRAPSSVEDCSKFVNTLPIYIEEVAKAFHELATEYSLKIAEEHQLPVTTKKLKSTNECIYSSLNSIYSSWKTIASVYESHKRVVECYLKERLKIATFHSEMLNKHREYTQSFSILTQPQSIPNVPSSCSIQSLQSCVLVSSNEIVDEFQTQLKEKQKLIAELEKEKEHWAFETELLRMKIKQQSKNGESEEHTNTDLGLNLVKEYFGDKLLEMNIRLQNEESKIVLYQKECHNLINIVQVLRRQKDNLQMELRQSATERNSLKDELETVRQGYESQMKMLSEHLAQMNHRLTKQTDEIEMLKQAVNEKAHKKGLFR